MIGSRHARHGWGCLAGVVLLVGCQPAATKGPTPRRTSQAEGPPGASARRLSEAGEPAGPAPSASAVASTEPPASARAQAAAPVPAADAEPLYDLAADLEQRQQEAAAELGKRASVAVVQDVLLVAWRGAATAQAMWVVKRALAAYFNGRFSQRPACAVSVYLFPNAPPYHAYCQQRWGHRCGSPYGFYLADERRIVMNIGPGIGTLTHELVHPIVDADFPQAPDWINEGIASLFERFHFYGKDQIAGSKNFRHPRLLQALHSPQERSFARLPNLFGMSDAVFRGPREDLHYAMARYLCQWLDSKQQLWPFYQKWRDHFADDPTGERAFTEVVGMSPDEAHGPWARWVRSL
jgi:hypothetical protein